MLRFAITATYINMSLVSTVLTPFGLESFDPEPFGLELMAERLTTEGLMAEGSTKS